MLYIELLLGPLRKFVKWHGTDTQRTAKDSEPPLGGLGKLCVSRVQPWKVGSISLTSKHSKKTSREQQDSRFGDAQGQVNSAKQGSHNCSRFERFSCGEWSISNSRKEKL